VENGLYDVVETDPMSFSQLEDKKGIKDAYEYLKMDNNRLNEFSKTPFHTKDDALNEIWNLREAFKNSFIMIDKEIERNKLILLGLDNGKPLLERWSKVKENLFAKFPCFSNDRVW
jgi:hypothetical protein